MMLDEIMSDDAFCSNRSQYEANKSLKALEQQIEVVCNDLPDYVRKSLHKLRELDFRANHLERLLYTEAESSTVLFNKSKESGDENKSAEPRVPAQQPRAMTFSFKLKYPEAVDVFRKLIDIHDERIKVSEAIYRKIEECTCSIDRQFKESRIKHVVLDNKIDMEEREVLDFVTKTNPIKRQSTISAVNKTATSSTSNHKRARSNATINRQSVDGDYNTNGIGEQKYCTCKKAVNSNMIQCESGFCAIDWYHLVCLGMSDREIPDGEWICSKCIADPRYSVRRKIVSKQKNPHPSHN